MAKKKKDLFEIPFRRGSVAWATVKALMTLGAGKAHPYHKVKKQIKFHMVSVAREETNSWDTFKNHKPKNPKTAKDANGRIINSIRLHQKITGSHKSGQKLADKKACFDLLMKGDKPMLRLRVNIKGEIKPIDEWSF